MQRDTKSFKALPTIHLAVTAPTANTVWMTGRELITGNLGFFVDFPFKDTFVLWLFSSWEIEEERLKENG